MNKQNLCGLLRQNRYPGRGIVIGHSADAKNIVVAYFIMGRSENSRNRIFAEDADGIRTQAFDPSKLTDPSLIIYSPVRVLGNTTIVTNGDQTDTIYEFLKKGDSFAAALRTRTFEPDAPNYTPRISGMANGDSYQLSILKSLDGDPTSVQRFFYQYESVPAGTGHLIHTYRCDGDPIPSFVGEPILIALEDEIDGFTDALWDALDPENKVSLFVRYIDLQSGRWETRIKNKNQ